MHLASVLFLHWKILLDISFNIGGCFRYSTFVSELYITKPSSLNSWWGVGASGVCVNINSACILSFCNACGSSPNTEYLDPDLLTMFTQYGS